MKIFFPLEVYYPSQAGGPANTVHWIVKSLAKHGFESTVVATDKGIRSGVPLNTWRATNGERVIFVKTRILYLPILQTLISMRHLFRADIVHLSSFFFPTSFITGLTARIFGKKIVWSARGELDAPTLPQSRWRKLVFLWFLKRIVGRYPVYHATSADEAEYIRRQFGSDANVVQISNYLEVPQLIETRGSEKYLLYIGRIAAKKAIDNLLRALADSAEFLGSDFVLKIAGRGKPGFENYLKKLVADLQLSAKVIFVGQIEGDEKQRLLADAYFTIMPSHTENFGNVVLESLAQGTPVVASKGSPWERLDSEAIGFWVDNTPGVLTQTIDKILRIPESEYLQYRSRSRQFVLDEFDIGKNIGKWIELYKSLK